MDDFIYDDIGFDTGSYGDVSNLFDYDFSSLFDSFNGASDIGFDLADLDFGGFDLDNLDLSSLDVGSLGDTFNIDDLKQYVDFDEKAPYESIDISGVGSTGDADKGTGQDATDLLKAEDIPGYGNQTAGEFGTADIYDLKDKGFSDAAVKQIAGDYLTESAIDEALANYGSGLSADETASFLDELDKTRSGIELQTLNDLQFAVTDATTLWKNTGNVAAVQQNLVASGLDPLIAADMANMAAMGMSESEIYDKIKEYYGDDAKYGEAFNKKDKPFWDGSYSSSAVTPTGDLKGGGGGGSSSSTNNIRNNIVNPNDKSSPWPAILGGLLGALTSPKVGGARGYQGTPKNLTASRTALSPSGAPGSGGKRFISQTRYAADGGLMELMPTQPNQSVTFMSAGGLPSKREYESYLASLTSDEANNYDKLISKGMAPSQAIDALSMLPAGKSLAKGGISSLGSYSDGGRMLKGPGDGMSDSIPATISGKRPARLADGEFVVPADVVSHLGNGSTDAGADVLYEMMNRVRRARTGNPKQGKQINPHKFVPKARN